MSTAILGTRLSELERSLSRVCLPAFGEDRRDARSTAAPFSLELDALRNAILPASWDGLGREIDARARPLLIDIRELREEVDAVGDPDAEALADAWSRYGRFESEATRLFGEFMELIGGLALRDRNLDPWFFNTADQLVRACSQFTPDHHSPALTVPWVHEAIARTLAQIVRLRFPDWTVWALPLGAFEFARIYLLLDRENPRAIRERLCGRLDWDGAALVGRVDLLADSFATFTHGPAYACAALQLRVRPEEAERGHVIFATLELMGAAEWGPSVARSIAAQRADWDAFPAGPKLDDETRGSLDAVAKEAFGAYERYLRPTARFQKSDWRNAEDLYEAWEDSLKERPNVPPETVPNREFTLREVLNAAWLARLGGLASVDVLAEAARAECGRIAEPAARAGHRAGAPGAPAAGGGPARRGVQP